MRDWRALGLLTCLLTLCSTLLAQPTVQELQKQVSDLRAAMNTQKQMFEQEITDLRNQVDDSLEVQLEKRIEEIVATKSMFFSRPKEGQTDPRFLFDSLKGGLIFTGLFRSRFEYRAQNLDFNSDDDSLDDEGVRINGRFRLGFGAVLLGTDSGARTDPQISALTEFQAVGTFANNSFVNVPGPGGVPLPSTFNILTEPFEEVSLYQGYLNFERLVHENIYIKAGRQEMTFGNEFILGNNSFYDGTVHDAVLVEWVKENYRISLFFAKEAASDRNLVSGITDFDEDELQGAYFWWQASDDLTLEAYALYFDARSVDADLFVTGSTAFLLDGAVNPVLLGHFWTLGARAFWTRISFLGGTLSLNAEAAYQTGSNNPSASGPGSVDSQTIHGWAAEFVANWRFGADEGLKPILTLAYYYAGGGDASTTSNGYPLKHIGFQPLFINRHFERRKRGNLDLPYYPGGGRYGNMDIVPLNNVHLAKAAISIAPSEKTEVGLAYVLAITADNEGWGTGLFGHEIDLFGSYEYNEFVVFTANVSVFLPEDTATSLSNLLFFDPIASQKASDDIAMVFYLQALITF